VEPEPNDPVPSAAPRQNITPSNAGSTSTATPSNTTLESHSSPPADNNAADATVTRLRSALAKSDAVILELRSSVRQLKRQLDKPSVGTTNNTTGTAVPISAADADAEELHVELDRAHAQILTADMVRRELEDTLEAEQYTWELRVQDQERTIQQLQQECTVLAQDLEQEKVDAKEKEETVVNKAPHADATVFQDRIRAMERERTDLQSCLDEALMELEAKPLFSTSSSQPFSHHKYIS